MLPIPTEFPQVGSYALLPLDGRNQLARIQKRFDDGRALVSLPLAPDIASGSTTVPLGQLIDGTPLSEAERQELLRLEGDLLQPKLHPKKKIDRCANLRRRDIHAGIMARLVARVPVPTKRGSVAELAA